MTAYISEVRQRKALGQVFLKEDWPCLKMVDLLHDRASQVVVEIGPGGGILTKAILARGISVTAVEKDERFAERLVGVCRDQISEIATLQVLRQDILRLNLDEWISRQAMRPAICGNIPYNISSSVLQWVIPSIDKLACAVFMVQKEFAERVTASPSTKAYGSLSVYAQLRAKIRIEYAVARTLFTPVPKVDSAVFILEQAENQHAAVDLKNTELLTKIAFSQRRKMMRNSISQLLKPGMEESLGIDLNRRPDSIAPLEYLALAQKLFANEA
jgi:16S rRNA (adenine1518-N6/adenine1519-N6)-dimethyltransferase